MENILEYSTIIITIIGVIAGGFVGVVFAFKKAKKEVLDVINKYKKYNEDGKLSDKEKDDLIKEVGEAVEESYNFYMSLKKMWVKVLPKLKKK